MKLDHSLGSTAVARRTDERSAEDTVQLPAIVVRVAKTRAEVETLREVWTSWKGHRDSDIDFCLEFVWSREEVVRPHVIVIYRCGSPVAMLVGRLEHGRLQSKIGYLRLPGVRVRVLTFVHGGLLGNSSADTEEEFIKSIINSLREGEADVALLHQSRVDSGIYQKALTLPSFACRDHLTKPEVRNLMMLPENIEKVYRGLSQGLRAQLRRKSKKILRDFGGSVKIQCFREPTELEDVIPQVEDIAKQTYQRRLGVGFQDTKHMRRRLRLCAEKGWLRIYLLTINDKPCAFWIGTVYDAVFCSDYLAYDPRFRDYSLGTFLLINMIEEFCRERVKAIDFGLGQAEYKERFGNQRWVESSVHIFAPNLKGLIVNTLQTATGFMDDAVRRVLEQTNLLSRTKRFWRTRLTKQATTA